MDKPWFDEWFERFWNVYTVKLCRVKGASLEVAKKKYAVKITSQKKADEIFATLLEQVRYRLKLKAEKAHQSEWIMPGILVYLNQERWEGFTIGSYSEQDKKPSQGQCGCGKPIDYAYSGRCMDCEGKFVVESRKQTTRDILTNMGIFSIGDTDEELNKKCRKYIKQNTRNVIYKVTGDK